MRNSFPLVSIVVPVYNVEKYIGSCINSILAQSYSNFEIILVDDGSTDNSSFICNAFSQNKKVRCFHKSNGGVSSARNYGMDRALGEYVTFVDSDDTLDVDCIRTLVEAIMSHNGDMCGIIEQAKFLFASDNVKCLDVLNDREGLLQYLACDAYSIHGFLFRKEILEKHFIRFREDMTCSEDTYFNREYLCFCNRIILVNKDLYRYNEDNSNSLSHKGHIEYAKYFSEKLKALENLCLRLQISDLEKNRFLSYRALHGYKVSLSHYASNFHNVEQLRYGFELSNNLILPWISVLPHKSLSEEFWYIIHRPLMHTATSVMLLKCIRIEEKVERYMLEMLVRFIRTVKSYIR